jgi:CheY-like chemotaxis protein
MDYSKYTVLIVDDEPSYRKFYSKVIANAFKAKIIEASNPREAFDYLNANEPPDLILLDMQMPVMDGYTALKKIRLNPKTANTPVIANTALNNSQLVSSLIKLNISDYIVKPAESMKVVEKIKKVFDSFEE